MILQFVHKRTNGRTNGRTLVVVKSLSRLKIFVFMFPICVQCIEINKFMQEAGHTQIFIVWDNISILGLWIYFRKYMKISYNHDMASSWAAAYLPVTQWNNCLSMSIRRPEAPIRNMLLFNQSSPSSSLIKINQFIASLAVLKSF